MAKILVVDDDVELAETIADALEAQGHVVEYTHTGEDALQMLGASQFDIVVLDYAMPGLSGLDVCKRSRQSNVAAAIIFVTAKSTIQDKEHCLDAGGDDYLVKPFDMRELSARVRSLLRRPSSLLPAQLSLSGIILHPKSRTVTINDATITLTKKESALLEYLMRHYNRTFTARELLDGVWTSETGSEEAVRTCIKTLRRKLEAAGRYEFITTVAGAGYGVSGCL